jgi:hypothetical protein
MLNVPPTPSMFIVEASIVPPEILSALKVPVMLAVSMLAVPICAVVIDPFFMNAPSM